jgi:hypothetical protein
VLGTIVKWAEAFPAAAPSVAASISRDLIANSRCARWSPTGDLPPLQSTVT